MQAQEYERLDRAEGQLWWFRALRLFLFRLLPVGKPGQRALDIGCGTGGLVQALSTAGYEVNGIDLSAIALSFARAKIASGLVQADAAHLPLRSGAFDLVTCVDLLEVGSVQPEWLVSEALRALRPGGTGFFVAAAHQWLLSEHDRAVNSVRRYDLGEMRNLLTAPDIEIVRAGYLFFLVFPLVMLRKLTNRAKDSKAPAVSDVNVPPALINSLLFFVCWIEAQILRFVNLPTGSSVFVMVKKIG